MQESKVKTYLVNQLIKRGWFVRLIIKTNNPGDPDLFTYKNGATVWIEMKKEGREPDPLQEYRKKEIVSFGMQCICIAGIKEAKEYLNSL